MSTPDTTSPDDSTFPPRGEIGVIDMAQMGLLVHVDRRGVADIQPGDGISKAQAALWLREIAKTLEVRAEVEQ